MITGFFLLAKAIILKRLLCYVIWYSLFDRVSLGMSEKEGVSMQPIINADPVSKWMTKNVITVYQDQSVQQAIQILENQTIFGLPVVNELKEYQGLVSKTVLMNYFNEESLFHKNVSEIMLVNAKTVLPNTTIKEASEMIEGCLPVVDKDGILQGIITRTDIIRSNTYQLERARQKIDYSETLKQVLESAYEGIVVVNRQGYVQEINESYCRLIDMTREEVIGRHVADVIENTRLHIIAKTGKEERGYIQRIRGHELIVHRIPIFKNQRADGAIGMLVFQDVLELNRILDNLTVQQNEQEPDVVLEATKDHVFQKVLGKSPTIQETKRQAIRAAQTTATVFISGESGTGKEVFARAIHDMSPVADGKFVTVNCSAIPESLMESELFGYEEGAFTDAKKGGKVGKFEMADNGTIFLDEIGDMPYTLQAKLLRVLQEQTIEKVGSALPKQVKVRVIAATHRDIKQMVKEGTFREDLYYRIHVIPLKLPSLKERRQDIPLFIDFHLKRVAHEYGLPMKHLTHEAMEKLVAYDWPGNVRQLINVCETVVVLTEGNKITTADLPADILEEEKEWLHLTPMEQNERDLIIDMLKQTNGNKSEAAKLLGIQRGTLYQKLSKYDISS